jgi:hypothetical protein
MSVNNFLCYRATRYDPKIRTATYVSLFAFLAHKKKTFIGKFVGMFMAYLNIKVYVIRSFLSSDWKLNSDFVLPPPSFELYGYTRTILTKGTK